LPPVFGKEKDNLLTLFLKLIFKEVFMKKFLFLILIISLLFPFCSKQENNKKELKEIYVFHAGSLSIPFKQIAEEFMKENPDAMVLLEAYGSRTAARQISDLRRRAEVMASADSSVIRTLLMPDYADFCIDFTTNEMVLMYTDKSKYSKEINENNWYEIIQRDDVRVGHSEPNSDPCGYRSVLVMKLTEKHYNLNGFYEKMKNKIGKKYIRPKEVDLIALLEANEIDYLFIYRSVAEQHKMKYVVLPDEVNLKSNKFKELYKTVSVEISGKKPGEKIVKKGKPMVYGITLSKTAKYPELGIKFIKFVLSEKGQEIMKKNGQPEIIPPLVDNFEKLPEELKSLFKKQ